MGNGTGWMDTASLSGFTNDQLENIGKSVNMANPYLHMEGIDDIWN